LEIASLFLKPGQRILSIKGRAGKSEDIDVPKSADPYQFPVVVLVNGKSASASEILAGALQDHKRGSIVGEPSYGKGLVQSVFQLSETTGLALTVAFYYTPSGRSLQRPLHEGGQLDAATTGGSQKFGIQPDVLAYPEAQSRLSIVLDASASFTSFATEYLRTHKVTEDFEVTPSLLDDFQVFLSGRQIRPGVGDWLKDRVWIQNRLKQEIMTLAFGVAKGDEVEVRYDPVVRRALERLK
jgi:carboxyl-terminal processing protease